MVDKIDLGKLKDKEKMIAEIAVEEYRLGIGRVSDALDQKVAEYLQLKAMPYTKRIRDQRIEWAETILKLEKELANLDTSIR